MEIGAILLLAAVLIGVGFFVAVPFMEGRRATAGAPSRGYAAAISDQELSSLLAERDRLINTLQELDFDYTLGKIPAEAYPAQREELLRRGADVLRRIDALNVSPSPEGKDAESRIEAAVAARRADASSQLTPALSAAGAAGMAAVDDDIESRVSARRSERKDQSGGFCPNCGKPVLSSDRFCPHCGNRSNNPPRADRGDRLNTKGTKFYAKPAQEGPPAHTA
jgi:hypothetical protein